MTKPMATTALVRKLSESGEDFEWYPTTEKMLEVIRQDMRKHKELSSDEALNINVLDCGAGDGRVLDALAGASNKYAIEKSSLLLNQQANDIIPVGTDFYQATLIDKKVDVVFSNPPYSDFEAWAVKIIREANATDIYLIIPQRWESSEAIKDALEARRAETEIVHTDDFLDADRKARAKIHILHIDLAISKYKGRSYRNNNKPNIDPFSLWFNETFPRADTVAKEDDGKTKQEELKNKVHQEMVAGKNLIESLVALYQRDMAKLQKNYAAACSLDPELMKELKIEFRGLSEAIQQRIKGAKHLYWQEFFSNYESITDRLTTSSRNKMLDTLNRNTAIEFTADNAYAITLWVIRNANGYYDSQLVGLVERMTRKANIQLYKSNQRTFRDEEWRYNWREEAPKGLGHYKLEFRIVLECMGGIYTGDFGAWEHPCGLNQRSHEFLSDVLAVAKTLGWNIRDTSRKADNEWQERSWESNKKQYFTNVNGDELMEVKAFKNGNLHIKFNQKFMKQLNVEFGRLKGWLKDHHQAAEELNIRPDEAVDFFNTNLQIGSGASLLLLESPKPEVATCLEEAEQENDQLSLVSEVG